MTKTLMLELEDIERETQEQDEAWRRTKDALMRLGPVQLAVPREVLSRIAGPTPPLPVGSVRA